MQENSTYQEVTLEKNPPVPSGNFAFDAVGQWLQKVRFRRKLFLGVSEADVWQKMEELNNLYEAALLAERARYDTLLRLLSEKVGEEE